MNTLPLPGFCSMKCAPGTSTAGGHFSDYPYQGWILTVWAPGLEAGF